MRPLLLKGHERPLTFIKYNKDGDLLFSCAKDLTPTVWLSDSGERLGTYNGHGGAVWACDVTRDSRRLITGSADQTVRLWNTETGQELSRIKFRMPARCVNFSMSEKSVVVTTDPFMGEPSAIHIFAIQNDRLIEDPLMTFHGHQGNIRRAFFSNVDREIISAGDDCIIRKWDVKSGEVLITSEAHLKQVNHIAFSKDQTHFVTASMDKTAKLFDTQTLDVLKTYHTGRPVNSADISPIMPHVLVGGGQEASQVTTTSTKAGKFESKFFHKIFEDEIGGVKGHFGPINAVAFHPNGGSFSSGGEDGYVRLHHFDYDYFNMKY